MPAKGTACSNCGYVLRKWGIMCPRCRGRIEEESSEDVELALAGVARKHLKKLEEKRR